MCDAMAKPKTSNEPGNEPNRGGRPPIAGKKAEETFQFRVTREQRAPWQASAEAWKLSESEWARGGLDAWVKVCDCAAQLGVNPRELVDVALADHVRVRAAIGELARASLRGRRSDG
jgi:hypothetical protein